MITIIIVTINNIIIFEDFDAKFINTRIVNCLQVVNVEEAVEAAKEE